ncbi:MAG: PadR family transcriptional regulator [Ktedonobacterales bacterium]
MSGNGHVDDLEEVLGVSPGDEEVSFPHSAPRRGRVLREPAVSTRGTMYEVYVLGELMEEPMHGYLLPQILSSIIGPYRKMSWGALYPLVHRLEEDGLIEPVDREDKLGTRQRKAYAITEAGRARFRELMAERGEYGADYRDLFTIKLSKFSHVDRLTQLDILRHYRGYVEELREYLEARLRGVATQPYISASERPSILRALNHRVNLMRADMQWVESEIAATEDAITRQPDDNA